MSSEAYTRKRSNRRLPRGRLPRPIRRISASHSGVNRLRATEVTSYLQYTACLYGVSLFAPGLKDDFEAHATLELQHADLLAQRIQQLGGVPSIVQSTSQRRRRASGCVPSKARRYGR